MNKVNKSIIGGVVGTTIMTMIMFVAPMMGLPKMSPPELLSGMMGMPIMIGWGMHFMIGLLFAFTYTYLFAPKVKINNIYLKGAVFGFAVFIFAQIAMKIMGAMFPMPGMEGSLMLTIAGSIMGHVIFGIVVSKIVRHATY